MKKIILAGTVLASLLVACEQKQEAKTPESKTVPTEVAVEKPAESMTVMIDPTASSIEWRGFKLAGLGEHVGDLQITSGKITLEGNTIVGGDVIANMTTINATDLAEDPDLKGKLEGHLGAPDFFDIENNQTAKFEVISATDKAITGNLTIRGISKEVEAEIKSIENTAETVTVEAFLIFDRQQHEVSYQSDTKDVIISDDVEVSIKLVAKK